MIQAQVVHHVPGRMRLRVPEAKRNPKLMQQIRDSIGGFPGVLDVSANPALGTLVVRYEPALSGQVLQHVTERASKAGLFQLAPPEEDDDPVVSQLDRAVDAFFGKANRIVEAATGDKVNLKEIFPFAILVYAVLFVDKAIAASQWLSWVQFALSTYLELHDAEPVAKVGESVEALRAELQALREELRAGFEKPNKTAV